MIKIDKGVEMPSHKPRKGKKRKYPFEDMEIGDSFRGDNIQACRVLCNTYGKKYGRKFSVWADGARCRVWRVS